MHRVSLALAALAAAAVSAPASAATITATTTVNVAKPVQLTKLQDMDFGTVILSGFTGTRTVAINQAGVLTCGANLVCQGVPKAARFNVGGEITVASSTADGTYTGTVNIEANYL
jgi:spore coat protein U-like protein